jgi:hypothetical protein
VVGHLDVVAVDAVGPLKLSRGQMTKTVKLLALDVVQLGADVVVDKLKRGKNQIFVKSFFSFFCSEIVMICVSVYILVRL